MFANSEQYIPTLTLITKHNDHFKKSQEVKKPSCQKYLCRYQPTIDFTNISVALIWSGPPMVIETNFLSFHKCDKVHLNTAYRHLKVFSFACESYETAQPQRDHTFKSVG